MAWTFPADVISAWIGEGAPTDTSQIETWIDKAERLIRFHVPGIQDRIDAGETDLLENTIDVTVAMVSRKFRNPEGIRQQSVTTGPFSEQRTFGGNEPGGLEILPDELLLLSGDTSGGRGAFQVDLTPVTARYPASDSRFPFPHDPFWYVP